MERLKRRCWSTLRLAHLGLTYDYPEDFTRARWPEMTQKCYLIYRGLMALYFTVWLIIGIIVPFYTTTNLWIANTPSITLLQLVVVLWFQSILVFLAIRKKKNLGDASQAPTKEPMTRVLKVLWFFRNGSYLICISLPLIYFSNLEAKHLNTGAVYLHYALFPAIYAFIDNFISAIPVRLYHVIHSWPIIIIWFFSTIIYVKAGNKPTHERLDPNRPEFYFRYAILMFVVNTGMWVVFLYIPYLIRLYIYRKFWDPNYAITPPSLQQNSRVNLPGVRGVHSTSLGSTKSRLVVLKESVYEVKPAPVDIQPDKSTQNILKQPDNEKNY